MKSIQVKNNIWQKISDVKTKTLVRSYGDAVKFLAEFYNLNKNKDGIELPKVEISESTSKERF